MRCEPACRLCVVAGSCVQEQLPATTLPRRKPRRAAVKATYPRDERPGYQLLTCGHYTDKATIEFYSVWQADKNKPWCNTCGGWRRKAKVEKTEETEASGTLF